MQHSPYFYIAYEQFYNSDGSLYDEVPFALADYQVELARVLNVSTARISQSILDESVIHFERRKFKIYRYQI